MMVKIGLIGIAAIFLAAPLRKDKGEFSMLIVLVAGMLVFVYALARMQTILTFLKELIDRLPIDEAYLTPLFKMLGITYVADFAANFSRESGYSSLAGQMELFAKLSIIALSIPELMYLVDVLENFL
ncbi:MAG: stage III sporulation AC/AD family protein [Lachnobacterium sp.]|nr:stage III sporulation AC/AD family protein [Lachnobacterium sp.]